MWLNGNSGIILLVRQYNFLLIAIDTNGFLRMKEEGQICKILPQIFLFFAWGLRLRAHVYVFKKIRFRKDPFWGVHTYRTSIRRPRSRSWETCLHLKITASVYGLAPSYRTFFVCFLCLPLLFICIASRACSLWKECS